MLRWVIQQATGNRKIGTETQRQDWRWQLQTSGSLPLSPSPIPFRSRPIPYCPLREATIKKFTTKVRVYWSDCDPAGILYYGNFFRFFEIAEEELYYALGWSRVDVLHQLEVGFPRVEAACKFYKPARQGDLMEVTTWIARRSQKSMLFHFEMRREKDPELAAEGHYTVVCVNRQFRPIPLPPELLELLREYLPEPALGPAQLAGSAASGPQP